MPPDWRGAPARAWSRRWVRRTALGLGVVVVVWTVAAARLFVYPYRDEPRPVDAIVMLGGHGERLPRALELFEEGWAPTLAISEPIWQDGTVDYYPQCVDPAPGVICFHPEPKTTRGEARAIRDLAAAHGWDSILVVTDTQQVTRARIIIERCYDGEVLMTDVGVSWKRQLYRVAYESGALLRAMVVRRSC